MLKIDVITLFPQLVNIVLQYGIVGRAIESSLLQVDTWNPRDYAQRSDGRVDDRPYGGGAGMVMQAEPLAAAIAAARTTCIADNVHVIHLSPQGKLLNQPAVMQLVQRKHIILVAGRYEGIDERVISEVVDDEWSIGDYVLSGGELPAMVLIDVLTRMLPGALGNENSAREDSFFAGLLDYPHYTRPDKIMAGTLNGQQVPNVLLSGNHQEIARWRIKHALGRTWLRRPDLLQGLKLSSQQQDLLTAFQEEFNQQK